MPDDSDPTGWLLAGIAFGLYWFFKGFLILRKYRLVADTPEIPIRSAAMGLVEVHGKACGDDLIESPVGGTPCLYSSVKIEVYAPHSDGNGEWRYVKTASKGPPFYLQDATGKILVDATGAEFDLSDSCQAVAGQVISSPPHTPIRPYQPSQDYDPSDFVTGGILGLFPKRPVPPSVPFPEPDERKLLEFVRSAVSNSAADPKDFRGMYRLTERCVIRGNSYDITGTCAENPSPRDPRDHNLLKKGENEATFLISTRNETDLKDELLKRAQKYIFGGGALAVASLATLLLLHHWL